uniref:Uncharacterized protein n=1 Tax=Trypanosoma congolense (strain IL3000) TaxID=1068625 RepID=G0UPG4_TRYCI|nr:conserved hypothetical protein [Trypanosoma congolense IL3000]
MLRVVAFGTLINDKRFYVTRRGKVVSYLPVGYVVERNVFVQENSPKSVLLPDDVGEDIWKRQTYYTATVKQNEDGGAPWFEVVRSDKPDEIHGALSPAKAWRAAVESAKRDFPDRVEELAHLSADEQREWKGDGRKFLGLNKRAVIDQLEMMASEPHVKQWLADIERQAASGDPAPETWSQSFSE